MTIFPGCLGVEEMSGLLAQLVEQRTFNPLVAGSNPAQPTKTSKGSLREPFLLLPNKTT